jgi:pimeloyl-ACP methyl ester carboxylesterase
MGPGMRVLAVSLAILACGPAAGCGEDEEGRGKESGSAGGEGERGQASVPPIRPLSLADLRECGALPEPNGYLCGSIEVPFERADPSLGTTEIGFAVKPRERRDLPSQGAIFAVEGGPGYASTTTAWSFDQLFGGLLRRRELVLVDMRGTGLSGPLECESLQSETAPDWIALSQCARKLGPRFESYRTSAAADDIDDVRRALDLDDITLYGDSYGTFLAQSYAFRHGEHLNAMVLDSAYPARGEDPWYPSLVRTGVRAWSKVCARSPECSGDADARLVRLAQRLRETRGIGALIDVLGGAAYGPPASYLRIERAGTAYLRGNREPWRKLTDPGHIGYRNLSSYSRGEEFVVGCNDYPMIWDKDASEPKRRRQLERAIREYPKDAFPPFKPREIALSAEVGYLECLTWPRPTELYEPPIPAGAEAPDVPVLVVSGELDDLTTPWEGKVVAEQFPQGRQFVAHNAGHVDALYYFNGSAAVEIREFLRKNL